MIKVDLLPKQRPILIRIFDYLWGGFSTLAIVFMLLAFWKLGSIKFGEFILPSPETVLLKSLNILENFKTNNIGVTLFRTAVGVGGACISGIILGLIAGYFKTARAFLKPIITILLAMPPIIWIVMTLFWFGFGNQSTIFTIFITVLPLTFSNSMMGMATVDVELIEMFDAYKLGVIKKIRYLYVPHLTSYIISSLNVAVSMGVKIVIMAELLGANNGIGANIADSRAMLDTVSVMAYVCIIISFIGLFEYLIIKPLQIMLMPWRR